MLCEIEAKVLCKNILSGFTEYYKIFIEDQKWKNILIVCEGSIPSARIRVRASGRYKGYGP
jgi:hypothetical protein